MNYQILNLATIAAIVLFKFIPTQVQAAELDSFTNRYEMLDKLVDETDKFNKMINYYIELGVQRNNEKERECSPKKVSMHVRRFLGGHWRFQSGLKNWDEGNLYRYLKYPHEYNQYLSSVKQSTPETIYRDFPPFAAPSLSLVSSIFRGSKSLLGWMFDDIPVSTLSAVFKIHSYHKNADGTVEKRALIIGSDKFTHFFNRGRKYWKVLHAFEDFAEPIIDDYKREQLALDFNFYSEASLFGAKSTGVSSYGDLAANISGIRFWNTFFGWSDPIFKTPTQAIVKCVGDRYVKVRDFDLRNWVNAAWDEGHNCSLYQKPEMANSVNYHIGQMENADGNRYHCPIRPDWLAQEGMAHYGRLYNQAINNVPYKSLENTKADSPEPKKYYPAEYLRKQEIRRQRLRRFRGKGFRKIVEE